MNIDQQNIGVAFLMFGSFALLILMAKISGKIKFFSILSGWIITLLLIANYYPEFFRI